MGGGREGGRDREERKGAPLRTKLGSARGIINQRAGGSLSHRHTKTTGLRWLRISTVSFFSILSIPKEPIKPVTREKLTVERDR